MNCQPIGHLRHLASLAAGLALAAACLTAPAAQAATTPGNTALNWAEAHATGHPFTYGGTGPYAFDCSGLVMESYLHAGIRLPHSTYAMITSGHLIRTTHPQRGDLAMYGADTHVEMVTDWPDTTFGAHDTGSTVGWIQYGGAWTPTAFYKVR